MKTYPFFFIWARRLPLQSKILNFLNPILHSTNFIVVASAPNPYFTLLPKSYDHYSTFFDKKALVTIEPYNYNRHKAIFVIPAWLESVRAFLKNDSGRA